MRLRLLQDRELLLPMDGGKLPGLDVLATQHLIDTLQAATAETQGNREAQQLVRVRPDKMIKRRGSRTGPRGLARGATKALQSCSAFVPEDRQQGKNKIRLVELHTFAVDADKDVRHLLFID